MLFVPISQNMLSSLSSMLLYGASLIYLVYMFQVIESWTKLIFERHGRPCCHWLWQPGRWLTILALLPGYQQDAAAGSALGNKGTFTRVVGCRPPANRPYTRPCNNNLVQLPIVKDVPWLTPGRCGTKHYLCMTTVLTLLLYLKPVCQTISRSLTSHVAALIAEEASKFFSVNRSRSCHVLVLTCALQLRQVRVL